MFTLLLLRIPMYYLFNPHCSIKHDGYINWPGQYTRTIQNLDIQVTISRWYKTGCSFCNLVWLTAAGWFSTTKTSEREVNTTQQHYLHVLLIIMTGRNYFTDLISGRWLSLFGPDSGSPMPLNPTNRKWVILLCFRCLAFFTEKL